MPIFQRRQPRPDASSQGPPSLVGEVLGKAVARKAQALLTIVEIPELHQGRLVAADPSHVIVELDPRASCRGVVPLHHASLTVWVQRRPYTMLSTVRAFTPPQGSAGARIELSIPDGVSRVVEPHPTWRVPVEEAVDVFVAADPAGGDLVLPRIRPFNLGPTGLQLRFTKDDDPGLTLGDEVALRLIAGERSLALPCLVSRVEPRRYELFLTSAIRGREVKCPDDVLEVVLEVQQAWLAARRRKAEQEGRGPVPASARTAS